MNTNPGDEQFQPWTPQQQGQDRLAVLMDRYNHANDPQPQQPASLKSKILKGAMLAAPVVAGAFGGTGGVESALSGEMQGYGQGVQRKQSRQDMLNAQANQNKQKLLDQILAEQRMDTQENLADKRMTLQERMQAEREKAAQDSQARLFAQQGTLAEQRDRASQDRLDQTLRQQQDIADQRLQQQGEQFNQRLNKQGEVGTWQLQRDEDGNAVMFNSKTAQVRPAPPGLAPKGEKPSADEQRRADLANNMKENLDQLEDILARRPDLFGPMAGRMTRLKQMVGTGDPDVAKLQAIREYLGMASVGAHAMRNAQHVGTAADAVMAGFNNSPDATRAAIQAARQSVATFQQDVDRARSGGGARLKDKVTGGRDFGAAPPDRPEGSTGKAPDGTPVVVRGGRIVAQ